MSVYIDPQIPCTQNGAYRWNRVTHLFADTDEELHAFAKRIGLKREWFQTKRLHHYDLNPSRRAKAISCGVIQLTREEAVAKWKLKGRRKP